MLERVSGNMFRSSTLVRRTSHLKLIRRSRCTAAVRPRAGRDSTAAIWEGTICLAGRWARVPQSLSL